MKNSIADGALTDVEETDQHKPWDKETTTIIPGTILKYSHSAKTSNT